MDWSTLYSPGAEILASLEAIVEKYDIQSYIKLRHELIHARYEEATGKWHVRIRRTTEDGTEDFDDEADFLFMGVGILHRWSWPEIEGLNDFEGTLVHSANWNLGGATWEDDVKDWKDKNVAVIGLVSAGGDVYKCVAHMSSRVHLLSRSCLHYKTKWGTFLSMVAEGRGSLLRLRRTKSRSSSVVIPLHRRSVR